MTLFLHKRMSGKWICEVSKAVKTLLSKGFVKHYADAVSKVQASDFGVEHRDSKAIVLIRGKNGFRKSARFGPENQTIVAIEGKFRISTFGLCRHIQETRFGKRGVKGVEIDMTVEFDFVPIIEAGTF